LQLSVTPLLASPQGGVAERSRKYREASPDRREAQARFLDDADTPPCSDARRGIARLQFIHSSIDSLL